jgi:hypothetical protein
VVIELNGRPATLEGSLKAKGLMVSCRKSKLVLCLLLVGALAAPALVAWRMAEMEEHGVRWAMGGAYPAIDVAGRPGAAMAEVLFVQSNFQAT